MTRAAFNLFHTLVALHGRNVITAESARSQCACLSRGRAAFILLVSFAAANAHDTITTKLTWSREISRIVYARCAGCHHPGGLAFSLLNYEDARPWAKAIEEEVQERRMPPWGAVKGFGDFRDDQALSQEQLELIAGWVEGGAPEGDPKDLPPPPKLPAAAPAAESPAGIEVNGEFKIQQPLLLAGIWPKTVPAAASMQVTAELPDGSIEPLIWLHHYKTQFGHPFYLRKPLRLPRGTQIHGVPAGSSIMLLPANPKHAPEHRNGPY